jgi:hypothetical protein
MKQLIISQGNFFAPASILDFDISGGPHFTAAQRAKWTFYLPGPTCQEEKTSRSWSRGRNGVHGKEVQDGGTHVRINFLVTHRSASFFLMAYK